MSLKIKRISLCDFRAFPGPGTYDFHLNGKNLLVYGENGSGKSSLFYALREFFSQSPSTTLKDYGNCFVKGPSINRYVEVEFQGGADDAATAIWGSCHTAALSLPYQQFSTQRLVGAGNVYERHPGRTKPGPQDPRVALSAARSGCIDYRSLLETNFRHKGKAINLFEVATEHLLADFEVTTTGGQVTTIGALWKSAKEAIPKKRNAANVRAAMQACVPFNAALNAALPRIKTKTSELLAELSGEDLALIGFTFPGVTYSDKHQKSDRIHKGCELIPEIAFRSEPLDRPQEFLNEARLSSLGLALYFAGRLVCTPLNPPNPDTDLRLLVLDDVLIGLDLSNRLPVLEVLQKHFREWQVVLLTHDRAWYEIARQQLDGWSHLELFAQQVGDYEQPMIHLDQDHLGLAIDFLLEGHVKAAAVHVRTKFEEVLKFACNELGLSVRYKSDSRKVAASDFWDAVSAAQWQNTPRFGHAIDAKGRFRWWQPKPIKEPLVSVELKRQITHALSWVMNPLSHSQSIDRYSQEIEDAIFAVAELEHAVRRAVVLHGIGPVSLRQMLFSLLIHRKENMP